MDKEPKEIRKMSPQQRIALKEYKLLKKLNTNLEDEKYKSWS